MNPRGFLCLDVVGVFSQTAPACLQSCTSLHDRLKFERPCSWRATGRSLYGEVEACASIDSLFLSFATVHA